MKIKYKKLTISQLISNWINRKMSIEELSFHIKDCELTMQSSYSHKPFMDGEFGIYNSIYDCVLNKGNLRLSFKAMVKVNSIFAFNGGGHHIDYKPIEYGVAEVNFNERTKNNVWHIPITPALQTRIKLLMNNTNNPPKIS
jgi:hypothetical protein